MLKRFFKGSIVALLTPFARDGSVDMARLGELIDWHITEGTEGIVPCGTTGESPTLSHLEHHKVIEFVVKQTAGRIQVIAGTGSNATQEAIELTKQAAQVGADGALLVTPYYNKPSQRGLLEHFRAIARAVPDLPLIIYNIPARSIVDVANETMAELAREDNIVGVKDATSDLTRVRAYRDLCGQNFCQLSGEDASTLGYMVMGGDGCISVTANVAPKLCAQFQQACAAGDWHRAQELHHRLMPLHQGLFMAPSPVPTKYVASLLGLCEPLVRLPLVELNDEEKAKLQAIIEHAGLVD